MITIKTQEEIESMKQGGLILKKVMDMLLPFVVDGVSTDVIDQKADELIKRCHAEPSFKKVKGYRWATCLPVNDQIVHTPPSKRILKRGDLLTIDIGVYYQSYHTDYAESFNIGQSPNKKVQLFLDAGKKALGKAIDCARPKNLIKHISHAIEDTIKQYGYYVVKNLTGHGIGKKLHEAPMIPGYVDGSSDQNIIIEKGMAFAIEVIYAMGTSHMKSEAGNTWSLVTSDGSLSACFERTIAVGENNAYILT